MQGVSRTARGCRTGPTSISCAAPGVDDSRSIALAPLDAEGVSNLASRMLDGAAPSTLVDFVEQRTNGNPFFVQELIRALRDKGALVLTEQGWAIRSGWDDREL